jgi:hypothetical protein
MRLRPKEALDAVKNCPAPTDGSARTTFTVKPEIEIAGESILPMNPGSIPAGLAV